MPESVRSIPASDKEVRQPPPATRKNRRFDLVCLIAYLIVLVASINHDSLWADEAFSAWVVSHRTFADMWHTLFTGDSSDLQMLFYLLYLHAVVDVLGWSEWAMRIANAPFAIMFGVGLYWTSVRVFGKRFAWLAPGLLPFAWVYAREARPYSIVLGCATVSLGCLLAYLYPQGRASDKWLPVICLGLLFVAAGCHMLALLSVPPMILIAGMSMDRVQRTRFLRDWLPAARIFLVPYLLLGAYFAFTFLRGTGYAPSYARPSLPGFLAMGYDLSGLMGLGPDHLTMWGRSAQWTFGEHSRALIPGVSMRQVFRLYWPTLLAGIVALLVSLGLALISLRTSRNRLMARALALASLLGLLEIIGLSLASGNQLGSRHWAAIVPIFLFLYLSLLNAKPAASASVVLVAVVWMTADLRLSLMPRYRKVDFRGTVAAVIAESRKLNADIAWAPDSLAARYYGIDFPSKVYDCFPLPQTCASGFSQVPWPIEASGESIVDWNSDRIEPWMANHARAHRPVIIVLRTSRGYEMTAWRTVIQRQAHVESVERHGLEVLTVWFDDAKPRD